MQQGIVYGRPGFRRPVQLGPYREPDVQGRVPRGWCIRCGGEVFTQPPLCARCRRQIWNRHAPKPPL